jgi:rubredoxin
MKYELSQYEKGKIHQGATEYTLECAKCGLQDMFHSHTGLVGATRYFISEGWKHIQKLWYCPGCSKDAK